MRQRNRVYPPNCTISDLNPSRFLAFREKQRQVEAEYGFRLGVPCRTPEQREGHRRYMRDWRRRYRAAHKEEIDAYRKVWLGERRERRRLEREAKRAEREAAKSARRAAWEEKRRLVKEKYGFDLGTVPGEMSPEESEARRRYKIDQKREYREKHKDELAEKSKAYRERQRLKRERRKQSIANLKKAHEKQRELKRQREAEAKAARERELAAKREAFAAKQKVVFEKYGFMLGRTPVTAEEIAGHDRYVADRDRAYNEANRDWAREQERERRRRKAEQRKHLAALNAARAAKAEEERRKAKAAKRIEERQRREAEATALAEAERVAMANFAAEREANRRAYLERKAERRSPLATRREEGEMPCAYDAATRLHNRPLRGFATHGEANTPSEASAEHDGISPCLPSENDAPLPQTNRAVAANGGVVGTLVCGKEPRVAPATSVPPTPPIVSPKIATGGEPPDGDGDDEIKRREEDFRRNALKRIRKAAAKKRKATIARKKREAAAQAAREAKAAAQAAQAKAREEARQTARKARLEAKEAAAREKRKQEIFEKYGFRLGKKPATPEEIEGFKRWQRDQEAEYRERHREKITAYNREYRRRKRREALERAQRKWSPEQWAAWEKKQTAKERGTPQWLMREVVKRLAAEQNLSEDAITERLIELGGLDFLMAGAESMGTQRCMNKRTLPAAVRALALFLDPDGTSMFKDKG